MKVTIPTEAQEQRALVRYLKSHPVLAEYYCKNNNEGLRSEKQAYHLKLLGMRPGVSDIFIYYPTQAHHGLWLEMKRNRKYTPSEKKTPTWVSQENFLESVKKVGFCGEFCYGFEDAKRIIQDYLQS